MKMPAVLFVMMLLVKDIFLSEQTRHHGHGRYDFIIVGGGTAGCVLANRLSENPDIQVLLLESGPSDLTNPFISVPLMFPVLQKGLQKPNIDWQFKTESQKYAAKEVINQESIWPQGRVLGGSSSINAMKLSRGSRHDYDLWSALGNEGWSYEDVLPYFKKLEDVQDPALLDENYRGVGGPIPVVVSNVSSLANIFVDAGKELGFKDLDQNGQHQQGFGLIQHNTRKGRRVNTAEGYIRPVEDRTNLEVKTGIHVTKIKIRHGKAHGVYFTQNDRPRFIRASKEVILSAGAIMSPVVLMHSGIGPKKHLKDMGIRPIADLPVGQKLQDHVFTYLNFVINESISTCPVNTNTFFSTLEYILYGTGAWSTTGTQGSAYMKSEKQPKTDKFPYLELFMTSCLTGHSDRTAMMWKVITGSGNRYYDMFHAPERNKQGFMIFPVLLHPRTTGTIELRDNEPMSKPKIKMDYLENDDDVKDLIGAIRKVQDLIKTEPFQKIGAELASGSENYPGCEDFVMDSDEYWECFIRHKTFSDYHYTSSCHMGRNGVVDNRLRVRGIKGLRVVDASIMPRGVSGNTMVPVIMIAEKASDMIKQDNTVTPVNDVPVTSNEQVKVQDQSSKEMTTQVPVANQP